MEGLSGAYPDQLEEMIRRVSEYNPQADTALIRRAYDGSAYLGGLRRRGPRGASNELT